MCVDGAWPRAIHAIAAGGLACSASDIFDAAPHIGFVRARDLRSGVKAGSTAVPWTRFRHKTAPLSGRNSNVA